MLPRRTKIVATLGPASSTPELVLGLARAGMDGARLNFSHGTHVQHAENARLVRAAQEEVGRPIALIADLQGPKLRIGELEQPITLGEGDEVVVTGDAAPDGHLPVRPAVVGQVLQPGHDVLIDDGLVRLRVEAVEKGSARCVVVVGGPVSANKGVNVPGVPVPIPAITRKDAEDLEFALELEVDFIALSFVRSAADVRDLKALINQAGSPAHVIAKIEKAEAVDALVPILDETDAVMVARGDLGVEIGPEVVPLLQKRIIRGSLDRGKPVITATQMLESMVHQPEPTRAEASDIANAILDGTSALMLSEETAVGAYPLEAVKTMDRIALAIEPSIEYRHQFPQPGDEPTVNQAMSNAACDLAETLGAKAILVPTFTGRTASVVARLRPRRPVIGLSHHHHALQHMALEWGVTPVRMPEAADVEELWASSLASGRTTGLLDEGDLVVLTAGTAVNIPGTTDMIKLAYA
ncbi:MAG TPA: pyruvate kinase [Gaiellaceae bacterium]|jgi:pyruvate kinase|nr:pyruvate kinase [Gaiellaceae bacterium]